MARLPAPTPVWYLRPWFWWQRRRYGAVLEPVQLWSRSPRALFAFMHLFGALRRRGARPGLELRALVAVRVSQLLGCEFCIDMNSALLLDSGAPRDKLLMVGNWRAESIYSVRERLALEFAEALTATPPVVSDALFERLRAVFSENEIVELTAVAAFQNMSARFNTALGSAAHGFCRLP